MVAKRKTYLDVAKGISMICIVLGHLGIYNINRVVYTFMVSIFFLISGYFLNDTRDIKSFILSKFKRLVIPYIFVSVIIIVFSVGINELFADGINSRFLVKKWVIAALFGTGGSDVVFLGYEIPGIGAIWFLLAMFWGTIGMRFLLEVKPIVRIVIVFVVLIVSTWSAKILFLPLSIQSGGVALFFIYIGYVVRQVEPYINSLNYEVKMLGSLIALGCWLESVIDYQWFLLVLADIGRGITDIFKSLCGCYIIIMLSKCICKSKILCKMLSFIGEYSIMFLSVHLLELTFFPENFVRNWLVMMGFSEIISLWIVVLLRFWMIIVIVLLLSKCNFIRKIFGFTMQKKEKEYE